MTVRRNLIAALPVALALILAGCGQPAVTDAEQPSPAQAAMVHLQAEADKGAAAKADVLLNDPATPVLGNPAGNVTVVEFLDYQCPYCKAAEPRLRALVESDPNVKLVIKDFPILTPESRVAARAALAAAKQGKYQQLHHAFMDYPGQLTDTAIMEIARSVGLDTARLRADMDRPEIQDQIISNFNLARSLKVTLVPGFVIGGRVIAGVSADTETSKIDFPAEVAKARAAP